MHALIEADLQAKREARAPRVGGAQGGEAHGAARLRIAEHASRVKIRLELFGGEAGRSMRRHERATVVALVPPRLA